jgi:hypothetical protein
MGAPRREPVGSGALVRRARGEAAHAATPACGAELVGEAPGAEHRGDDIGTRVRERGGQAPERAGGQAQGARRRTLTGRSAAAAFHAPSLPRAAAGGPARPAQTPSEAQPSGGVS